MRSGLTEEKIARLDEVDGDPGWTAREALALELAERLALDPTSIGEALFARLRAEFREAEILELGMMIGQYVGFGRLLRALDLDATTPVGAPDRPR